MNWWCQNTSMIITISRCQNISTWLRNSNNFLSITAWGEKKPISLNLPLLWVGLVVGQLLICIKVWYGIVWYEYSMVLFGVIVCIVWFGMVWFSMIYYVLGCRPAHSSHICFLLAITQPSYYLTQAFTFFSKRFCPQQTSWKKWVTKETMSQKDKVRDI